MFANNAFNTLLIIGFVLTTASAITRNNTSTANKNLLKTSHKVVEPRGYEYGLFDGYGGGDLHAYGKSDYYWLIPLVIVIGFGALLLPLLGTLMTTMITTGTINLTAGRRKRDVNQAPSASIAYLIPMLAKLEEALDKFEKHIKSDVSPLMKKMTDKNL